MTHQRAHVVIPTLLVKEIDEVVGQRRRSQFLVAAAERELSRLRQLAAIQRYSGAWKRERHPELEGKGGTARFVRRLRRESDHRL